MAQIAPTGTLRQRQPRVKDKEYLQLIQQCPCVICLTDQRIDAAHVRVGGRGRKVYHSRARKILKRHVGMGEKPDDKWALPLCRRDHTAQHATDEELWWESYGIDPLALCRALWAARDDLETMQGIVRRR